MPEMKRSWWLKEDDGGVFVMTAEGEGASRKVSRLVNKRDGTVFGPVQGCRVYTDSHIKFFFHGSAEVPDAYVLHRNRFEWNRSDLSQKFREHSSVHQFVQFYNDICGDKSINSSGQSTSSHNSSSDDSHSGLATVDQSSDNEVGDSPELVHNDNQISIPMKPRKGKKRRIADTQVPSVSLKKKCDSSASLQDKMAKEVQEAYCGTYKINIDVLQVRDNIRECDSLFLKNLKKQMEEFADEAYQPLCVVVEDVECSVDFDSKKINGYTYSVIGGQHCLEATKEISKSTKYSSDKRFKSRNCVVYCGLSAEQKQWLAVKHNSTGEYRHAVTLKDKVAICRKLKENIADIKKWKATCGLILNQSKGSPLVEVACFLAGMSDPTHQILQDIFTMSEDSSLKGQKCKVKDSISKPDIPPYVFRPIRTLDPATVTALLTDVRDRNLSIAEMHKEGQVLNKLALVQKAFLHQMDISTWEEAQTLYPDETSRESLARFLVHNFRPNPPAVFINYCHRLRVEREEVTNSAQGKKVCFLGEDRCKAVITEGDILQFTPEHLKELTGHETGVDLVILDMPMELDQKEVKAFVVTIKNLNVSVNLPQYTILVMCEMHEISMVKETLKAAGYCKVDLGFYHIEDAVPDSATLTNAVHPIVIGYWNQDRQLRRQHINTEGDKSGKRHNLWQCKSPELHKDEEGRVINTTQKSQELMTTLIELFSFKKQWVLDACCGTGSAVAAAMQCSRNCIGVDIDHRQAKHAELICESAAYATVEDMSFGTDTSE